MKRESPLDPVLSGIEFPGEDDVLIRKWLESRDFAGAVVRESRRMRVVSHQSVLWGSSLVAATGGGILAGSSPVLEAAGAGVATFACLLFGVLVTASVVGLLATLHPSWSRGRGREPRGGPQTTPEPQTRP